MPARQHLAELDVVGRMRAHPHRDLADDVRDRAGQLEARHVLAGHRLDLLAGDHLCQRQPRRVGKRVIDFALDQRGEPVAAQLLHVEGDLGLEQALGEVGGRGHEHIVRDRVPASSFAHPRTAGSRHGRRCDRRRCWSRGARRDE